MALSKVPAREKTKAGQVDTFFAARSLDVYISRRRQLPRPGPQLEILHIRGVGYKLLT